MLVDFSFFLLRSKNMLLDHVPELELSGFYLRANKMENNIIFGYLFPFQLSTK